MAVSLQVETLGGAVGADQQEYFGFGEISERFLPLRPRERTIVLNELAFVPAAGQELNEPFNRVGVLLEDDDLVRRVGIMDRLEFS